MLHLRGKKNCRKSVLQLRSSEGICCRWVQVPLPHLLNVPRTWGIAMNYLLRLTPSGIQIRGMAHPQSLRHPLFRRRWFADDFIITCVRWYLRFNLVTGIWLKLARELGVSVAPSTVLRWVIRFVPEFEKCWQAYERPVGDSWRVDSDLPQSRRSMDVPLPRC